MSRQTSRLLRIAASIALAVSMPIATARAQETGAEEQQSAVAAEQEQQEESAAQSDEVSEETLASEDATTTEATPVVEESPAEAQADADAESATTSSTSEIDAQTLAAMTAADDADAYAALHEGTVPDGVYCLTTALDGTYSLDVRGGSTKSGAQIILYKAKVARNQRWQITNVGGGYVTIKSAYSGRYLQIAAAKNGTVLVQGDTKVNGSRNQLWVVAQESDGSYSIASALNKNYVLNVRHGAKALVNDHPIEVIAYKRSTTLGANERWNLSVTEDIVNDDAASHIADLPDGMYLIAKASAPSKVMDVRKGSQNAGANIITYTMSPSINQAWVVSHDTTGYLTITSAWSGKVLDVKGGKAADGSPIIQWTSKTNARNQQWIATLRDDGTYTITSALLGWRYVLDVSGTSVVLRRAEQATAGSAWSFQEAPSQLVNYFAIEDGNYLIKTALNQTKGVDKTLDASQKTNYVNLWDAKSSKNQQWVVTHDKNGFVHFTNGQSGLELGYAEGRLMQLEGSHRWVVIPSTQGLFTIAYDTTGKVMDVSKNSTANGAKVIVYKSNGTTNQQWQFEQDNGFTTIDGKQYLIDATGKKLTGLRTVNGKLYYFDPNQSGALATKGVLLKGASKTTYVNPDTEKVVSGLPLDGKRYVVAWDGVLHELPETGSYTTTAYERKVAQIVAECIVPEGVATNDLQRVKSATQYVYAFIGNKDMSRYTINWSLDKYFAYAYGPFSFGRFSCAGCTEALTLILHDLGYTDAEHVNYQDSEGYPHQYCALKIDGKYAWADGEIARVGFTTDAAHPRIKPRS